MSLEMHHDPRGGARENEGANQNLQANMEMIQAAMMAELGIRRLDDLPLEDKGYKGEIPTTAVTRPLEGAARNNVWQTATFDDIDPAMEELDDIAGGYLYRLRRETTQTAGSSVRAGQASHGSHVGRGGLTGKGGNRGNTSAPITPFFNDTRKGRDRPDLVQAALTELRKVNPEAATNESSRSRRRRNQQQQVKPANPVPTADQAPVHGGNRRIAHRNIYANQSLPGRMQNSYATGVLASQSEFVARMNIKPAPVVAQIAAQASESQVSAALLDFPEGLAASRCATSDDGQGVAVSKVVPTQAEPTAPVSVVKHQFRGLAASKFATPTTQQENILSVVESKPARASAVSEPKVFSPNPPTKQRLVEYSGSYHLQKATDATLNTSVQVEIASELNKFSILKSQGHAKISIDGAHHKFGNISLLKYDDSPMVILQVEVQDSIVLREAIMDADMFTYSASTITFHAISKGVVSPIWKFTFRLPNEAFGIWQAWNMVAGRADRGDPTAIEAISNLPCEAAVNNPSQGSGVFPALPGYSITAIRAQGYASQLPKALSILLESLPATRVPLDSQQESGEAVQISTSTSIPENNRAISSNNSMGAQEEDEMLIDFESSEEAGKAEVPNLNRNSSLADEPAEPNIPNVMDLVVGEPQAKWILSLLDARPEGPFLKQIMNLAKFEFGTEPTPKLFKAAGWVVKGYFMFSETFHQLPDELMDAYVEESAKKVLLEAISAEAIIRETTPPVLQKSISYGGSYSVEEPHSYRPNVMRAQESDQTSTRALPFFTKDVSTLKAITLDDCKERHIVRNDEGQSSVATTSTDANKQDNSLIKATQSTNQSPVRDSRVHRTGLSQSLQDFHFAGGKTKEIEHEDSEDKQHLQELKMLKEDRILAEEQLQKRGGLAASRFAPANIWSLSSPSMPYKQNSSNFAHHSTTSTSTLYTQKENIPFTTAFPIAQINREYKGLSGQDHLQKFAKTHKVD